MDPFSISKVFSKSSCAHPRRNIPWYFPYVGVAGDLHFNILYFLYALFISILIVPKTYANHLDIKRNAFDLPYLLYGDKPLFAFGASPQTLLTYLPRGNGNDVYDWANWAKRYGINHIRSYPPSFLVVEPAQNVFKKSIFDPDRFDLNVFNGRYFKELRKACVLLKKKGIIVHLQLWQAVCWKENWASCYYNPENNVNPDISLHAGPGEFVTTVNSFLLANQKRYVVKVLDATGDLGNVFYDIMNEIGNGTGINEEWVREIIRTINQWEKKNNTDLLVTLDDGGGRRMGNFPLVCDGLDLIVLDSGRYEDLIEHKQKYGKPIVLVRNVEYDYEKERAFHFQGKYSLEINANLDLQSRGRRYWWRTFLAGVQIAAGCADTYSRGDTSLFFRVVDRFAKKSGPKKRYPLEMKASYRLNQVSERNFLHFRMFVDQISDYRNLRPLKGVIQEHPVRNSYSLQSRKQTIIYLESPDGKAGFDYDQKVAKLTNLMLDDGSYQGIYYFPADGRTERFSIKLEGGTGKLLVPDFRDDLAIIVGSGLAARAEISVPKRIDWVERDIVLEAGPPGAWDMRLYGMISPCTVIKKDGTYFLYYIGADGNRSADGGPRHRALGVATSKDGIHFTKYPGNPIITHLPHSNEEEGVFSAAAMLDENGNVVLYYGAMNAGSPTSESVDSDIRLAFSINGIEFKDLGDVLSHGDKSVWGHGDELFPVGAFHANDTWYVYYIAKGRGVFWDLGLAWGPSRAKLPHSQAVLTDGSYIIGGCDPIWLDSKKIGLFIVRDFRRNLIEVRAGYTVYPDILGDPVMTYKFKGFRHTTIYLDKELNTWFMYLRKRSGNAIRVFTAEQRTVKHFLEATSGDISSD